MVLVRGPHDAASAGTVPTSGPTIVASPIQLTGGCGVEEALMTRKKKAQKVVVGHIPANACKKGKKCWVDDNETEWHPDLSNGVYRVTRGKSRASDVCDFFPS